MIKYIPMKHPGKTIFYTHEYDYRKIIIPCRFIKVLLSAEKNKH